LKVPQTRSGKVFNFAGNASIPDMKAVQRFWHWSDCQMGWTQKQARPTSRSEALCNLRAPQQTIHTGVMDSHNRLAADNIG
jgi:hypothetical protein